MLQTMLHGMPSNSFTSSPFPFISCSCQLLKIPIDFYIYRWTDKHNTASKAVLRGTDVSGVWHSPYQQAGQLILFPRRRRTFCFNLWTYGYGCWSIQNRHSTVGQSYLYDIDIVKMGRYMKWQRWYIYIFIYIYIYIYFNSHFCSILTYMNVLGTYLMYLYGEDGTFVSAYEYRGIKGNGCYNNN
jgi:hypothetical protein